MFFLEFVKRRRAHFEIFAKDSKFSPNSAGDLDGVSKVRGWAARGHQFGCDPREEEKRKKRGKKEEKRKKRRDLRGTALVAFFFKSVTSN